MKNEKVKLAQKALQALYIEVDATVASDVQQKVLAAFKELEEQNDSSLQHIIKHFENEKDLNDFLFEIDKVLSEVSYTGKRKIKGKQGHSSALVLEITPKEHYWFGLKKCGTVTLD